MKSDLEVWNERRRRTKQYIDLKAAYDEATGSFVQRAWAAAQALDIAFIDAVWMMSAWRDASGAVVPTPENFDPVRDAAQAFAAEPPTKRCQKK